MVTVSAITDHFVSGNLRTSPLPASGADGSGNVYVVWQDCRFRAGCVANDMVLATSPDGVSWMTPTRIPLDPVTSTEDHFIPGLAVDLSTNGGSAHLTLTFYFYPSASCTSSDCLLEAGITSSDDGGSTWTAPKTLTGPMSLSWLPNTFAGLMVGDYVSALYSGGKGFGIIAVAQANSGTELNEAIYATSTGLAHDSAARLSSAREYAVPGAASDHPPHPFYDVEPKPPKRPEGSSTASPELD
jgi:hypothetical protein